jgi:hypothetical protein
MPVTVSDGTHTLPVVWKMPPAGTWRKPGLVKVAGTATDVLGKTHPATALVTVDVFTSTQPTRAKTYPGGLPALPATVVAVGKNGGRADVPVTWKAAAYPAVGVVTVGGTAQVVPGVTLPASVRVQVTTPVEAPLTSGVTVAATFTEPGYATTGLTNGDTTDKAWSNWKSSGRNATDTLTATLPAGASPSRLTVHFYKDNSSGGGLPQSMQAGVPDASGACVVSGAVIPVGVDSPLAVTAPLPNGATGKVCVVLTAVPNGYLTVSELQVFAKAPGIGTDPRAAAITVAGRPIRGFNPAVTNYRVRTLKQLNRVAVTATAIDPYATVTVTGSGGVRLVRVTAENGTSVRTYRITIVRY